MTLLPTNRASDAVISADGVYRYLLTREWRPDRPALYVGMLNPSTADARFDDPTVRKLLGFGERLGCGSLVVWNLFAFRTAWPAILWQQPDPIGPENDGTIDAAFRDAAADPRSVFVIAWGALPNGARARASDVLARMPAHGLFPKCWGKTADGFPRHPARLAYATVLDDFTGPAPT